MKGWSLVELLVTLTIMTIIISYALPSVQIAMEQARIDMASAELKTIWGAQRIYWAEYQTFSFNIENLVSLDLLDATMLDTATQPFGFYMFDSDTDSFVAIAVRGNSNIWQGELSIDEEGSLDGSIKNPQERMLFPPSY